MEFKVNKEGYIKAIRFLIHIKEYDKVKHKDIFTIIKLANEKKKEMMYEGLRFFDAEYESLCDFGDNLHGW